MSKTIRNSRKLINQNLKDWIIFRKLKILRKKQKELYRKGIKKKMGKVHIPRIKRRRNFYIDIKLCKYEFKFNVKFSNLNFEFLHI